CTGATRAPGKKNVGAWELIGLDTDEEDLRPQRLGACNRLGEGGDPRVVAHIAASRTLARLEPKALQLRRDRGSLGRDRSPDLHVLDPDLLQVRVGAAAILSVAVQ